MDRDRHGGRGAKLELDASSSEPFPVWPQHGAPRPIDEATLDMLDQEG